MRGVLKKKIGKILCGALMLAQLGAFPAYAKPDWPADTGIQAEAGALMDVDSGTVMFSQNGHVEYPPASITKILTALIVLEHADLSDTITYSDTAMLSVEADSGNKLSLVAGDTMTVEDSLYALLLTSVNQSANALAEHVAGSIPAFVDMMNEKLAELGCTESHFENPSGLNGDTQVVSAIDMAKIAAAAYSNPKLLEISSTLRHKIAPTTNNPDGITVVHEHRLIKTDDTTSPYYCPSAKAGKTGYLLKAGNTLVTYAEQDGKRLVSVILKGSPRQYFVDGKELLDFGFAGFQNVDIAENETRYVTGDAPVDINGTTYQPSELAVEKGRVLTLPNNAVFADAELSLEAAPEYAPEGTLGVLSYVYNERKIGTAYLMTKAGAEALAANPDMRNGSQAGTAAGPEDGGQMPDSDGEEGQSETVNSPSADMAESVPSVEDEKKQDAPSEKRGGLPMILIIGIITGAAFIGGGLYWISYSNKKEAEASALRREQRRKRLSEEGAEVEAEFNRLLEEKRQKSRRQ